MSTSAITSSPDFGSMSRRTLLTVCTAAGLTGMYALYAQVVTPWVSPGTLGRLGNANPMPAPPPPPENVRMAQEFLPSQPWAAAAKYQVRTAEAFVYANEWEPAESDQAVRFRPFAMIFLREGKPDDEVPITVVAESAYLKFQKKFDVADPDPGRVIGGALQGTVRITGPNGLAIAGRNFVYSEEAMRLWSDDKVQFAWSQHRGVGHGLQVELIADETATQNESISVTGVQSIRLRRNVAMDLAFDEGETSLRRAPDASTPESDAKKEPIQVRVRSAGTFEFDIEANVATFSDNVRVYRPTGPDEYDSLQCDQLTLMLEPAEAKDENRAAPAVASVEEGHVAPPPDAPDGTSPAGHRALKDGEREGNFRNLGARMEIRRARARGKQVVLISETNNLTATMTDLIYDVQKRVASLTTPEGVKVTQGTSEIRSPGITLLHDEDGKLSSIWCQGPGWLRSFDPKTRAVQLAAQWMRQLRKYPEPESGLDIIELEQQALVRQPAQKMGLAANFIRLWIEPQELRAARPGERRGLRDDEVRLRRMLALNDVALVSREMNAETERLEVLFDAKPEGPRETQTGTKASGPDDRNPVAGTDDAPANPQSEIRNPKPEAADPQSTPSEPEDGPIEVFSDLIRVRVLMGKSQDDTQVAEVWTEGNVQVTQEHESGEEPLVITGDKLHLENRSKFDQVLHVSALPAHIYDRGFHIEGRNVHLDRGKNLAWVDGAGLLQLPVNSSLEGEKLDKPQLLDVWWKEKMTFDGEFANFFGDVRSVLNDSRLTCQQMEVALTSRVLFTASSASRDVNVKTVDCRDGVEIDSTVYEGNRLSEVRRGQIARFTLDQITGNTHAHGPGYLTFWRRGNGRRAQLGAGSLMPVGKSPTPRKPEKGAKTGEAKPRTTDDPPAAETAAGDGPSPQSAIRDPQSPAQGPRTPAPDSSQWEYTRVDFAGKADGNVQKRYTTFADRVQVVYGPVERPLVALDPDNLPKDGGWMRCDELRLQQHESGTKPRDTAAKPAASGPGNPPPIPRETAAKPRDVAAPKTTHIELLGSGNAELEGRTFHARADTISYDESKGLYVLRSFGARQATIWRQTQIGGEQSRADAQRMEFVPSRNQLKLDRATGLDAVQ